MDRILICILLFCTGISAFAGGVSDGGGSSVILSGEPIEPTTVRDEIPALGKALLTWSYGQKLKFDRLSAAEKIQSPMAKLFSGSKTIVDQIKTVQFEMRMNQPCRDANNRPVDGSIYGTKAGSLCMSPYYLAIKLDSNNYVQATAALLIHEISHMLGTSEAEAVAIQKVAIDDFTNWTGWGNFKGSVATNINHYLAVLAGTGPQYYNLTSIQETIDLAKKEIDGTTHYSSYPLDKKVLQGLDTLNCGIAGNYGTTCDTPKFLGIPHELGRRSSQLTVKSQLVVTQIQANDGDYRAAEQVRNMFNGKPQISGWDATHGSGYLFYQCFGISPAECEMDLKTTVVRNPTVLSNFRYEMQLIIDLLTEISNQVIWLERFKLNTYVN